MSIKSLTTLLALVLLVGGAGRALAHPGGHGPVSDERALEVASLVAVDLSLRDAGLGFGKLDASWVQIPEDAKEIHVREADYIIVSIRHEEESRSLYVLMSPAGEPFDANLTGDFPALKDTPEAESTE
jgi:hypothetical protein